MQIFSFIPRIARSKLIENRLLSVIKINTDNIFSLIIIVFCIFLNLFRFSLLTPMLIFENSNYLY